MYGDILKLDVGVSKAGLQDVAIVRLSTNILNILVIVDVYMFSKKSIMDDTFLNFHIISDEYSA
jgi:hypothetical protein